MCFLCVCVCACANVKLCMCVLILVAATRSYSRSTGALHTPDTFGAAGEGWVQLFLCTSPTHSTLIFLFCSDFFTFIRTAHLLLYFFSLFLFLSISPQLLFLLPHSRMSNLPVEPHASARSVANWQPSGQFITICFLYLALPLVCGDTSALSCFMSIILFFLPPPPTQWHLQCHLTSHPINLQGWLMGNDVCVCWINVTEWMMKRVRCLDGGSSVDKWETTWRVGETDSFKFFSNVCPLLSTCVPPQVHLLASVSPVVSHLQSVPWGSSTQAQT